MNQARDTRITLEPLRPERNVIEAFLLGLALWTGIQAVFLQPEQLPVDALLGPVWTVIWTLTLLTGSVTALVGLFWRGRSLTGLSLQEMGYAAFAPASLARAVALVAAGQPGDAVVIFAFGAVCVGRIWQLERRIGRFYPVGSPGWVRRWTRRG